MTNDYQDASPDNNDHYDADRMNEKEKDVLREIASIGAGHAATALAEMLSHTITMDVPKLRILPVEALFTFFGDPESEVAGIVFNMHGDMRGSVLYIIDKQLIHQLLSIMLNKEIDRFDALNDMDYSALTEIGNIVVGSYISAISETTGLQIFMTPPNLTIDMLGAILNYPLQVSNGQDSPVLFVEDTFLDASDEDKQIVCHLLILPESDSLSDMLRQLGIEHG